MATTPEGALWQTMRKNLPAISVAERVENRHGGGFTDVVLFWAERPFFIELKAPRSIPKSWYLLPESDVSASENDAVKNFTGPAGQPLQALQISAARLLRPSQIAFHNRIACTGVRTYILARPTSSKILYLFSPLRGPAAPGPAAPVRGSITKTHTPAAPDRADLCKMQSPAAPPGPLRAPDLAPEPGSEALETLRLAEIGQFRRWPELFEALRAPDLGQNGAERGP